jgi:hypothetical protein
MKRFLKSLLILCVVFPLVASIGNADVIKLHKFVVGSAGTVGAKNSAGNALYSTVGQLAIEKRSNKVTGPQKDLYQGFWMAVDDGTDIGKPGQGDPNANLSNYPNPFTGNTTIRYFLPDAAQVKLKVYDIMGNEISVLVDGWQNSGNQEVQFTAKDITGKDLSTGTYMYELTVYGNGSKNFTLRNIMVMVK